MFTAAWPLVSFCLFFNKSSSLFSGFFSCIKWLIIRERLSLRSRTKWLHLFGRWWWQQEGAWHGSEKIAGWRNLLESHSFGVQDGLVPQHGQVRWYRPWDIADIANILRGHGREHKESKNCKEWRGSRFPMVVSKKIYFWKTIPVNPLNHPFSSILRKISIAKSDLKQLHMTIKEHQQKAAKTAKGHPFWSFFACFLCQELMKMLTNGEPAGLTQTKSNPGRVTDKPTPCVLTCLTIWLEWWEGVSDLCAFNLRVAITPRWSVTSARFAGWCQAFSMFSPFRPSKTLISPSSSSYWLFYPELKTLQSPGCILYGICGWKVWKGPNMKRQARSAATQLQCLWWGCLPGQHGKVDTRLCTLECICHHFE